MSRDVRSSRAVLIIAEAATGHLAITTMILDAVSSGTSSPSRKRSDVGKKPRDGTDEPSGIGSGRDATTNATISLDV